MEPFLGSGQCMHRGEGSVQAQRWWNGIIASLGPGLQSSCCSTELGASIGNPGNSWSEIRFYFVLVILIKLLIPDPDPYQWHFLSIAVGSSFPRIIRKLKLEGRVANTLFFFFPHDVMLEIWGHLAKISTIAFTSYLEFPWDASPFLEVANPIWGPWISIGCLIWQTFSEAQAWQNSLHWYKLPRVLQPSCAFLPANFLLKCY